MPTPLPPPERAVVRAINVERVAAGVPALRPVRGLVTAAERHSQDQKRRNRLGHDSSDGSSFTQRIARAGRFTAAGEVLAFRPRGSSSRAAAVVRMWMRSPGHRAQLLDPRFRVVGVGRVRGARGAFVTADLART